MPYLKLIASAALLLALSTEAQEPQTLDQTISFPDDELITVTAEFKSFLQVSPFLDGTNWFLTQSLLYRIPGGETYVDIPRGFQTDFASIPRPFWSVLPTWGKYGAAAVVHDFLYWDQRCTREQADAVLLVAMTESEVSSINRVLIYRAVRWGGALAWKANSKERAAGRERVVPVLPDDPAVTWKQYQHALFESGHRPDARPSTEPVPPYCTEAERLWREFVRSQH